ncbi:unnamed protein product [Penicillium egyptiacum]|uniref:Uncharacterized protein n=1 Tax=Penicillium egyptiacum TaxID=1303716 RepID=A0A9W4P1Q4_9EURO|nr:unnamed protein product [Penicillium egyptiacum]
MKFLGLLSYSATLYVRHGSRRASLPPGPRPKPVVGNLGDLPPSGVQDWQHWLKHKDLYGHISSLTVFGRTIIVLNDVEMALELLEKRSAVHSSRPNMTFAGEM